MASSSHKPVSEADHDDDLYISQFRKQRRSLEWIDGKGLQQGKGMAR